MDVLTTHFEQYETAEASIQSLREQLGDDDEIYVVDAGSTDDSFHLLERFDSQGDIRLVHESGVTRGMGRQYAFELSDSDVVVAQADLDSIFRPVLPDLVDYYETVRDRHGPGLLLAHGCLVGTRRDIERADGWNDLQVHEDKDLWVRADSHMNVYHLPVSVVEDHVNFEWDSASYRLRRVYQNYRDGLRLGIPPDAFRRSIRYHCPRRSWPSQYAILSLASLRASGLDTYETLADTDLDPRDGFLRELTFDMLQRSGHLSPERVPVPDALERYESSRTYPGQTSYSLRWA